MTNFPLTGQPATDEYAVRIATADDWEPIRDTLGEAFGEDEAADVQNTERGVFEPERTLLAVYGDEIAGVAGAFTRQLTVPGSVVPAAHVTWVGVRPTHRRRGVLTRLMHRQLTDVRTLGEPVAVLWASEGPIYQRFGYGLAASRLSFEASHEVHFLRPPTPNEGRLRAVALDGAADVLAPVYERVRAGRPGWSSRDARWWRYVLADPESARKGATRLRITVHEGQSGVDGYMLWQVRADWPESGPQSSVRVRELDVDLTRTTGFAYAAADEPLYQLVDSPRQLGARLVDGLWVRLVDVPVALAARRYVTPVDVVIEVSDPLLPENSGRWHLLGDTGSAACTRTDRAPELAIDVAALGAAYLGGASLSSLAAGGRVTELSPGTLTRASIALGWYRLPSPTEVF
jgi:predicted acetyltransferase